MAYETFTLSLAGLTEVVHVATIERDTLHRPVLARLRELSHRSDRLIALVAGVPGGGKTLLTALWSALADRDGLTPPLHVLPLDGFHLPNAVLEERRIRQYKGRPESFDVDALVAAVARLARGEPLWWPRYDRTTHEPVAQKFPNSKTATAHFQNARSACLANELDNRKIPSQPVKHGWFPHDADSSLCRSPFPQTW